MRSSRLATFEQLSHAQEQSRQQKERGLLRPPRRWKRVEFKVGDRIVRTFVPIETSARVLRVPQGVPIWATGLSYCSVENLNDPFIAIKQAMQRSREPRSVPMRVRLRWRPKR
jgi:hypothetical protein